MTKLKIANLDGKPEIFHSIQGEGKNIGQPSVFIRTSLCNLHCIWCDTDYTWNWEKTRFAHVKDADPEYKKYKMDEMIVSLTPEEIYNEVVKSGCKNIVLTGGEPMMQLEELSSLMEFFNTKAADYFFEIETNGTLLPDATFESLIDQYNVSPKLANSNNPKKLREKPAVYQYFSTNEKAVFKFVIASEDDLTEVLTICETYNIPNQKVYLMPEGTNPEALQKKQQWLIEICKNYQFNYTDRLHVHIYGDKRGV
ncbi:7-carboxy-7-deazaguanine synthase QueE [Kordia jejudonensis]|uniref:7-carboxy-7-deazaguanine synthase QueE n=1 Tax=Kordia jejudonensis TaxID=1348245 RepID=UPI0006293B18|nr:7-carboxy-7-deazaguanine synthase QueE [Kordia jejudonensis]